MSGAIRAALFALRRLRHQPLQLTLLVVALAAAGAIVGTSSIVGALALESSVHDQIAAASPAQRALEVEYRLTPGGGIGTSRASSRLLARFRAVTTAPAAVQVWDPVAPADERGTHLVVAPAGAVRLSSGRLPRGCVRKTCQALALSGGYKLGQRVPLGRGVSLWIVGLGSATNAALPDQALLAGNSAFVPRVGGTPLARVESGSGSTVSQTALLIPGSVHGWQLHRLAQQLRVASVRLERGDSSASVSSPAPLLDQLGQTGSTARNRLLLVSSDGAALLLAFAAFVAALRRRELERMRLQLETLGGSRRQVTLVRAVEVAVPALLALVLVLAGLRLALVPVGADHDLPGGFVGEALPLTTLLSVIGLELIGVAILFAAAVPHVRRRFGVGPLEVAALTALAVVVWQSVATGGLDPSQIASGAGGLPVLLLTPALTVLAAGIILLRLLPLIFRLAERLARRAPIPLRLALLAAARSPGPAAATTTFLAVALGSALFSLNYRATLDQQAQNAAAFAVGAAVRITSPTTDTGVPQLLASRPVALPALRLSATVDEEGGSNQQPLTLLALPADEIPQISGWRGSFSPFSRGKIARRLRPKPLSLSGPRLTRATTAIRLWARTNSTAQRAAVLHLLTAGGSFISLPLGPLGHSWRLLSAPLTAQARDSELVGIEFPLSSGTAGGVVLQPGGVTGNFTESNETVDFGGIAAERDGRWRPLPSLADWTGAQAPDFQGVLAEQPLAGAPFEQGLRFQLNGTSVPLVRPPIALETPVNSSIYLLPALLGANAAALAVDRQLTIDVLGQQLRLTTAGTAQLFPTVTTAPGSFAVVDYQTLFAALNADDPGLAPPNEAWFNSPPARPLTPASAQVLRLWQQRAQLRDDPLAAGTRRLLTWSGYAAAALALVGLIFSIRLALAAERQLLAEYEALGVGPRTLGRSVQLRLVVLCLLGFVAALAGAALAIRVVAALVAVTATAGQPLPPIQTAIAWQDGGALLAAVAAVALLAAAALTGRGLREAAGGRLRR